MQIVISSNVISQYTEHPRQICKNYAERFDEVKDSISFPGLPLRSFLK